MVEGAHAAYPGVAVVAKDDGRVRPAERAGDGYHDVDDLRIPPLVLHRDVDDNGAGACARPRPRWLVRITRDGLDRLYLGALGKVVKCFCAAKSKIKHSTPQCCLHHCTAPLGGVDRVRVVLYPLRHTHTHTHTPTPPKKKKLPQKMCTGQRCTGRQPG